MKLSSTDDKTPIAEYKIATGESKDATCYSAEEDWKAEKEMQTYRKSRTCSF